MKNFVIPPNSQLDLMHQGNAGYFCLAQHYIGNEEYRNFFKTQKEKKEWILLDNGAGDHALITEDILIKCAKDLMPNEIVPPDILFNSYQTLINLDQFIERMQKEDLLNEIEIHAVPQGNTKEEWIDCYLEMLSNPHITTIGISKLGVPHAWLGEAKDDQGIMEARHLCINYLLEHNLVKKNLHWLGMGSPEEYKKYVQLNNPFFRSTDSCYSILSGMNNLDWSEGQFTRIPTPKDYFDRTMTEEQIVLAKKNIVWFKNLLNN